MEAVLAPLDAPGRPSVLSVPPNTAPSRQPASRPLDAFGTLGRAFVGQVWDRLQPPPNGQLTQNVERVRQLEEAVSERAVEVGLPGSSLQRL